MDVAPRQIVGISAALIPFLEHDDANRALMGSNMQRQAVPLLQPDVPIVSTGMENQAAYDSGQVLVADEDGEVISVQGDRITVRNDQGEERIYRLRKYNRSNQSTCIDQRPVVYKGQRIFRARSSPIVHRPITATWRWVMTCWPPSLLGRRQLRRCAAHQRGFAAPGQVHQHPHRKTRDRSP
jgi:DNA-directed RNA polymerase beta subunit